MPDPRSPDGPTAVVRGFEIRPVRPEEYETLGALTEAAYRTIPEDVIDEAGYDEELRDVAGRVAAAEVLVAVDPDGTVLGGVTYVPGPDSAMAEFTDADAAGIRMLAVDAAARGRGVGRALTVACLHRAIKDGRRRIVLHATVANAVAQGMYERMGFRRAPSRDWTPIPTVELLGFELTLD